MHVTVRKYRTAGGDRTRIAERVNREFLPLISKIDGFVDFYAFNTDDGVVSVSVFQDAKGGEESVRAAARWVGQTMASEFPDKPEVISGEVFAHRHVEQKKAA
jgi:hypothetical protein